MSDLAVRASHRAFMRLKRRAAGGGIKGYDDGGAPDQPPAPAAQSDDIGASMAQHLTGNPSAGPGPNPAQAFWDWRQAGGLSGPGNSWADRMGEAMRTGDRQAQIDLMQGFAGSTTPAVGGAGAIASGLKAAAERPQVRVSPRMPVGAKSTEDPLGDQRLQIDLESMKNTPTVYNKSAELAREYPNLTPAEAKGTPDQVNEALINHATNNILWLHDQVPPEIAQRSQLWYDGGNKIVNDLAARYGIDPKSAAALIATQSPQRDWYRNVDLGHRIADITLTKADQPWSPEMTAEAAQPYYAKGKIAPLVQAVQGKSYNDLSDPTLKALWVRMHDMAHNSPDYSIVTPEGEFGPPVVSETTGANAKRAWSGSLDEISRGIQALEANGDLEKISPLLGENHKVRSFYNNLIDPNSPEGDVTIDTHAVAAGLLRPLSGTSPEVDHNFGKSSAAGRPNPGGSDVTGVRGNYPLYAEAYRRAAAARGILPRQMQSITWEAVRGLFSPSFKRIDDGAIDRVWQGYQKGQYSLDDARSQILKLAGGIDDPTWYRPTPPAGDNAPVRNPADAGELSRAGVPGGAASVERGAGSGAAAPVPGAAPGAVGAGRLEEGPGAPARGGRAGVGQGRTPLVGLPQGPFQLEGEPYTAGPNAQLHDIAEQYMRSQGAPYDPPQTYQKVDKERAGRIAQAYDAMKHDPNDPAVKASYNAMIQETLAQYQAIKNAGIKFELIKQGQPNPYEESPRLAAKDVEQNGHLWVYPTEGGFGSVSKEELANNPLLQPTNEVIDGHRLVANDVFRIVHDVFGHLKDGNGFRADGEENAWRSHSAMYSPLARPAMTSETRGQNSWLNYGPHGDKNRTAKSADTIYADQKTGLLPPWVMEEGRADPGVWDKIGAQDAQLGGEPGRAIDEWVGGPHNAKALGQKFGLMVPSRLEGMSDADLHAMGQPVRDILRAHYGDTIPVYRGQGEGQASTGRQGKLASYTTDPKIAAGFAGVGKDRPLIPEEEIARAEQELARTGQAKAGGRTFRKNEFGSVDLYDRDDQHITDTPSVRHELNTINQERSEINAQNVAARSKVYAHQLPVDDVVWATDRFGQKELIARKPQRSGVDFWSEPPKRRSGGRVPTAAQKEAGNYAKDHIVVHGLPISIENRKGSTRSGVGRDGKPWAVVMPAHYGYFKRSKGADGDAVDAYVGPHFNSKRVFVVNQHDADTGRFDEHKVMLGFASLPHATRIYDAGFSDGKGPHRRHSIVELSLDDLKQRLGTPGAFKKSIKRAVGGAVRGYDDGGAPTGAFGDQPETGTPFSDVSDQAGAQTLDQIRARAKTQPWYQNVYELGEDAANALWTGAKQAYSTASEAGAGKLDLSSPEGADKFIRDVVPYVTPMAPEGASLRGIARARGFGKPTPPVSAGVAPADVTADALARQKAADEFNIRLSRGNATQDSGDLRFEDMASRGAYGAPAQQKAQPFFEGQFGDIKRAGTDIGQGLARDQNVAGTQAEAANTINTEVGARAAQARQMRDQAAQQAQQDADTLRMTTLARGAALDSRLRAGQPPIEGARDAGTVVGAAVRAAADRDRAGYQQAYTAASNMEGEFAPGAFRGMGNRVQGQLTLGADPVFIDDVTTPIASRALQDLDQNVAGMRFQNRSDPFNPRTQMPGQFDPVSDSGPVPIDMRGVDQARKRLVMFYRAARRGGNASDARATGRVIDAFDDQIEQAVQNGLFSGDPRALQAIQDARAAYSNYAQTYRPRGAGDDVGNAMRRIIDRQATPEEISNMVLGSGRLGNAGLPVRLADRLEGVLGGDSNAWAAIRQAMWQRASQVRNAAGEIDPGRSAQSILDFTQSSIGQRMFSPAERQAMQAHARGVQNIEQQIAQLPSTARAAQAQSIYEAAFGSGAAGPVQSAVFRRIVEGTATPEETAQAVFNSIAGGNPGNTSRLIGAIQNIAGRNSDTMAAIRQGVWQRLTSDLGTGRAAMGQQKLVNQLDAFLNGKGAGIAKQLYSDAERFQMARYMNVVKDTIIGKYARTNSDTAIAAGSMLERYGSGIQALLRAGVHVATSHLPFGWLAGQAVNKWIEKGLEQGRQATSAARVNRQFDWLDDVSRAAQPPKPNLRPATGPMLRGPYAGAAVQGTRLLAAPPVNRVLGPTPSVAQPNQQPNQQP